MYISTLSLFVG